MIFFLISNIFQMHYNYSNSTVFQMQALKYTSKCKIQMPK